jgi:hypothetical protein
LLSAMAAATNASATIRARRNLMTLDTKGFLRRDSASVS